MIVLTYNTSFMTWILFPLLKGPNRIDTDAPRVATKMKF